MTDLPDLIRWMREGLKGVAKVAPGPWETDSERQDDAPYRHLEFALFDARGLRLCGTENSDTSFGLLEEEGPDEYGAFSTWNGPALTLMEHIKRCSPDNIAALLDHIDAQAARIAELEGALKPFAREADTWLDSLPDQYRPGVSEPKQKAVTAKAEFSLGNLRHARALINGESNAE